MTAPNSIGDSGMSRDERFDVIVIGADRLCALVIMTGR